MNFGTFFLNCAILLIGWGIPQEGVSLTWIAFGDLRGHVEPCGCDPLTDLGGIRRIDVSVAEQRGFSKDLALYSLGNNAPKPKETGKLKAILQFEERMRPDAVLWNRAEAAAFDAIQKLWAKKKRNIPYVLSVPEKDRPPMAAFSVRVNGQDVMGYTDEFASVLESTLIPLWRSHSANRKTLLFSGKDKSLQIIRKADLFHQIISSNTQPFTAKPEQLEKREPGRLLRLGAVYMVPSFGQGLLRHLQPGKAPVFEMDGGVDRGKDSLSMQFSQQSPFIWLTRKFEGNSSMDEVMKEYNEGAAILFQKLAVSRAKDLKNSPFAGAAVCAACHQEEHKVWKNSAHAGAIPTLAKKSKDQDPECVSCHVVGYDQKGGFASMEASPQFAGVQCENCHGAGLEHVQNQKIPPAITKPSEACIGCHNSTHSPSFGYDTYWPKIKHGKP